MLYSVAQTSARILHAWVKGPTLYIKKSEYIKIGGGKIEDIKLYLRWMLGEPIGYDTDMDKDRPEGWDRKKYWQPVVGWY